MAIGSTKVVQVTNIAPQATKDQMQTLFGYLGKIEDIRLYPTIRDVSCPVQSRICYIKFMDAATVGIAQHMTNTVFIDRALIVIPVQNGDIPDEYYALEMTKNGTIVPGLCPSEPKLPPNVVNSISGTGSEQMIVTSDPQLEANGLPSYPPLPVNYDSCKIEEVRRTVLVVNPDPSIAPDDLINFFTSAGEVKYLMACTRESDHTSHMLGEFSEQASIIEALKLDSKELKGFPITVTHSTQAIVKPQAKSNEAAQREIEEAMSRVKEAQNLISATIDPVIGMLSKDKRGSRRSRSRSRGRRRRTRSRSQRRSRSRHRSRSRRRRSRSRSRDRKKRSKSRSKRTRSRSRSRRSRSRHDKRKSKERAASPRKSKEKERVRSKDKDWEKSKERTRRSRDKDRKMSKEKDRERSKEKRDSKVDKESSADVDEKVDKKRSHSPSRYRSRSRDRKARERKRSRSRGRRRTPSPRPRKRSKSRSKRSRSRSKRSRSKSRDKKREKKEKRDKKARSKSQEKTKRNYDEEKKTPEILDAQPEKETSDNMDISNSP